MVFPPCPQMSEALLQERDQQAKWHGIPVMLQRLYDSSHLNSDLSQIHSIIKVQIILFPDLGQSCNTTHRGKRFMLVFPMLAVMVFAVELTGVVFTTCLCCLCGVVGSVTFSLHGGYVVCDRWQESSAEVHLSQHIHLWPLWRHWCESPTCWHRGKYNCLVSGHICCVRV